MTTLMIVIIVLAVGFLVGLGMRMLHVVQLPPKASKQEENPDPFAMMGEGEDDLPFPEFPEFDQFQEGPPPAPEMEAVGGSELVDLVDYFAEEEEGEETALEQEAAPQEPSRLAEEEESRYDRLCNLPVGRGFLVRCQNTLSESAASGQRFALAYFDYNRFRFINSLKGYSIGDYVLQKTTQEVRSIFPEGAMVSRLSADHFVVLFPWADQQQLTDYAELLRRAVDRIRGDIGAKSGLHLCMGVATTDSDESSYDVMALIHQANIARHCLKITKGDDPYVLFDPSMVDTFLYGESALEDYSEYQYNDEFEVYFQPVYSLSIGRIGACEALARWTYEDHTTEAPPTPETGTLPTNNLKVIYHAFKSMSRWRREGNEIVPVLVNLSILDLYKEDIDAFFVRCLAEFQIEPKLVTAVIDVHTVGMHWPMAEKQLGKLKDVGMTVAVGALDRGFRNLDFLGALPVRYVKLHRSVAHDVASREDRQQAVREVLQSAKQNGLETVFEGVDYSTAAAYLKEAGAAMAEGAYAGLPSRAEDFGRTLQDHLKSHRNSSSTMVLDDETLARGNYNVY